MYYVSTVWFADFQANVRHILTYFSWTKRKSAKFTVLVYRVISTGAGLLNLRWYVSYKSSYWHFCIELKLITTVRQKQSCLPIEVCEYSKREIEAAAITSQVWPNSVTSDYSTLHTSFTTPPPPCLILLWCTPCCSEYIRGSERRHGLLADYYNTKQRATTPTNALLHQILPVFCCV